MSRRTHYEHREPPLRYQGKPNKSRIQSDTHGLFSYTIAFVSLVVVLGFILLTPMPDVSVGQDRLFLAVLASFATSATFTLLMIEMKEVFK